MGNTFRISMVMLFEAPTFYKWGRFTTGHSEYETTTLMTEYDRDVSKGLSVNVPKNYFPEDDPSREPLVKWRGHDSLLFSNWLNYYVYQETPFDLDTIG